MTIMTMLFLVQSHLVVHRARRQTLPSMLGKFSALGNSLPVSIKNTVQKKERMKPRGSHDLVRAYGTDTAHGETDRAPIPFRTGT